MDNSDSKTPKRVERRLRAQKFIFGEKIYRCYDGGEKGVETGGDHGRGEGGVWTVFISSHPKGGERGEAIRAVPIRTIQQRGRGEISIALEKKKTKRGASNIDAKPLGDSAPTFVEQEGGGRTPLITIQDR